MHIVFGKEFIVVLKNNMKYLKIEDNKGFYWDGKMYQEIDKINKDDLLKMLNAAESVEFELDKYEESHLGNKAHQVIYENLYSKFEQFMNDKDQFKNQVENLYKEAINKYGPVDEVNVEEELNDTDDSVKDNVNDDIPF